MSESSALTIGALARAAGYRQYAQYAALLAAAVLLRPSIVLGAQELRYDREYPVMRYSTRNPTDRVAELQRMIARGQAELRFEPGRGYLVSLLAWLDVPVSSQMLVFSGTSLQERLVSAARPRAIYFKDDIYVAWSQGSDVLEIAALDANLGPVFYTLRQEEIDTPDFQRQAGLCLECHDTYGLSGGGVPRFLIGSGPTDVTGQPATHGSWQLTTDETPLSRRWGGWYVTGTHGDQVHAGNIVIRRPDDLAPPEDRPAAGMGMPIGFTRESRFWRSVGPQGRRVPDDPMAGR